MTEATTDPKPPLTAEAKRALTGPVQVAINMHNHLRATAKRLDKQRVMGDVAFLQTALATWTDDGTPVCGVLKRLVEASIAEAATDKRLTGAK